MLSEHIFQTKKSLQANAAKDGLSKASDAVSYPDDAVIIVEHPRIFTMGRGGTADNLKFDYKDEEFDAPAVRRVERGGEVTWHGPGQMVVYPVLDLNNDRLERHIGEGEGESKSSKNCFNHHKKDLHWYVNHGLYLDLWLAICLFYPCHITCRVVHYKALIFFYHTLYNTSIACKHHTNNNPFFNP